MSGRSDIEYLQELVVQLSPQDAELINRLERTRLTLEFMLAGIRSPTMNEESEHDRNGAGDPLWRSDDRAAQITPTEAIVKP
jgi:hypothetical protein